MNSPSNSDDRVSRLAREAQEARIALLRRKLGLPPICREAAAEPKSLADLDDEEGLLRYLLTLDRGPTTTFAKLLIADGIELPPPDTLQGQALHAKLWEVVRGLAKRRVFLSNTNHLTDAELYDHLWRDVLNDPAHELDEHMGDCGCHVDLLGDGSFLSEWLYFQFHATADERDEHLQRHPDAVLPDPRQPPSDRDRHLPNRYEGESGGSVIMLS